MFRFFSSFIFLFLFSKLAFSLTIVDAINEANNSVSAAYSSLQGFSNPVYTMIDNGFLQVTIYNPNSGRYSILGNFIYDASSDAEYSCITQLTSYVLPSGYCSLKLDYSPTNSSVLQRSIEVCSTHNYVFSGSCSTAPNCTLPALLDPVTNTCKTAPNCTLPALLDPVTNTCKTASCSYPASLDQSTGFCRDPSSCSILQYFNSDTGQCQSAPRECGTSLFYNRSNGQCVPAADCSLFNNTVLDPSSNTCVFDPNSCGSTEYVDYSTNRCVLRQLVCPAGSHTHASPTNDACLPDAPVTCPAGQHDPGTYTCVANNSQPCAAGQSSGLVNGVFQCVNAGNSAQNNQTANDAAVAAKAAQDAANVAKNQYDAAVTAANDATALANANPNSQTLAANAAAANQNAANAHTALDAANLAAANAQKAADDLSKIAQQDTLRSVDDSLKSLDKYNKDKTATAGDGSCSSPPSCSGDPIACSQLTTQYQLSCHGDQATQDMSDAALGGVTVEPSSDVGLASLDSAGFGLPNSCPSPREFSVLGKSYAFSYDGFCSIASVIGNLLMITASFIALRILVSP